MESYQKLVSMRSHGSRRTKVFIRRAIRKEWATEGIISAVKFGAQHFKLMDKVK